MIEMGAGTAVPTVRLTSEQVAKRHGAVLIRVNPREAHAPPGSLSLAFGALEALQAIQDRLP